MKKLLRWPYKWSRWAILNFSFWLVPARIISCDRSGPIRWSSELKHPTYHSSQCVWRTLPGTRTGRKASKQVSISSTVKLGYNSHGYVELDYNDRFHGLSYNEHFLKSEAVRNNRGMTVLLSTFGGVPSSEFTQALWTGKFPWVNKVIKCWSNILPLQLRLQCTTNNVLNLVG